jgi:hypothetical protein
MLQFPQFVVALIKTVNPLKLAVDRVTIGVLPALVRRVVVVEITDELAVEDVTFCGCPSTSAPYTWPPKGPAATKTPFDCDAIDSTV